MSLSAAMSNALSGLTANARAVDVISSTLANVQTPGYGPRQIELGANATSGGVSVLGVSRASDLALLNDQRAATAETAGTARVSDFYSQLETTIGLPGDSGSLGDSVAGLESALIQAAAAPDQQAGLSAAVDAAKSLAEQINTISDQIATARTGADAAIATGVSQVNTALAQTADLDVGDYIQVTRPPSFLTTSNIDQLCWGFTETLNAYVWTISINAVPEDPYSGADLPTW